VSRRRRKRQPQPKPAEVDSWRATAAHLASAGLYGTWQTPATVRNATVPQPDLGGPPVDKDGFCIACQEQPGWCKCPPPDQEPVEL